MPNVTESGASYAIFNGGTITHPLTIEVAQGGAEIFVVEDNTASEALSVQNDLTVQIGQAHAGLSAGMLINPDSGGVYIQANSAAHDVLHVADENSTVLLACLDGDTPLRVRDLNGVLKLTVGSSGIGFFGHAQAAKPTVTGAKLPSDTVIASLLTALVGLGLITDSTT